MPATKLGLIEDYMTHEALAAIIAAFISFISLVGFKVVDHRLSKGARKIEERNYLKDELTKLWKRVDSLDDEITVWRDKYYRAQDSIATLRAQIDTLTDQVLHLKEQLARSSMTSITSITSVRETGPTAPNINNLE